MFLKHVGFSADEGKSDSMGLIPSLSPHAGNGGVCPLKTGSRGVQIWQLQQGGIEFPRDKATTERRSQPEPDAGSHQDVAPQGYRCTAPVPGGMAGTKVLVPLLPPSCKATSDPTPPVPTRHPQLGPLSLANLGDA